MQKDAGLVLTKRITGNPLYDQELERAPWEIAGDHYYRIDSPDLIDKSLNVIKEESSLLVLTSTDGQRFGNTILVAYDQSSLHIDKPNNFDEKSVDCFHIYFKDILGVWSYFQVRTLSGDEAVLCASYPEALYRLQRRQYQRVKVPAGTRVDFREDDQLREGGFVKDLSAGGILICTGTIDKQFSTDTVISDITITLPLALALCDENNEQPVALPVIRRGRIVRTYIESESNQVCHGVAFEADGASEKELAGIIEIIKERMVDHGCGP